MSDDHLVPWDDVDPDLESDECTGGGDSELAYLPEYVPERAEELGGVASPPSTETSGGAGDTDEGLVLRTLTNPPGTVTVTVRLDGRIHHIDLAPEVRHLTEHELTEEIRILADLAWRQARSEIHEFAVAASKLAGLDPVEMGARMSAAEMPSRAEAEAVRSRVFAERYYRDND